MLDQTMFGETLARSVINKINNKLIFVRRLLCSALIHPHFDYPGSAWYPNLNTKLKNRIQTSQNKCIRFCLHLDKTTYIP